jgi:hypothetical protein
MGENSVRLKYGVSENFSPGGGLTGVNNTEVTAKVKNIAFAKEVAVRYAQMDGTWVEAALAWQKNCANYDLFFRRDSTFVTREFVIRYSVAGLTFWDNNNSANFHVDPTHPNAVGGRVVLSQATARRGTQAGGGFTVTTSWVEGDILVQNLSFNKRVGIRLSANRWGSFADTNASFSGTVPVAAGLSNVETWRFKTPELNLDTSVPDFRFAVFYDNLDTGEFFWDNNFGQDYSLSKNDLSTND